MKTYNYTIFQLDTHNMSETTIMKTLFEPYERAKDYVARENYKMVYTDALESEYANITDVLEQVYIKFQINHPKDFKGHSLSISDVVFIKDYGYYYCDRYGFTQLKQF